MNKRFLILGLLLSLGVVVAAVISSYGSITGFVTVQQAIEIDILGSSNDENYTLTGVHQGETKFSPEIKIDNKADVPINVSISLEIMLESAGNENDVELSLVNEFQNESLPRVVTVPTTDLRFYVRHSFKPAANIGEYAFRLNVTPV